MLLCLLFQMQWWAVGWKFSPSVKNISLFFPVFYLIIFPQQFGDDIHGHGEDDGAVVLCRDAVEGLEVAELGSKVSIFDRHH